MNTDRQLISTLRDKLITRQNVLLGRRHNSSLPNDKVERLVIRYKAIEDTKGLLINNEMVDILNNDLFEIYVYNSEWVSYGGEPCPAGYVSGWEIKWVLAPNREAIKKYPFFDCIISRNDNSTGQARSAELFIP